MIGPLLLATTNTGKIREIRAVLDRAGVPLLTLADVAPVAVPEESGASFWENARLKALAYAEATGHMVVAEDSGLEVAALGGAPGVLSARFLGPDVPYPARFEEIYRRLEMVGTGNREARFTCALAVASGPRLLFEAEAWIDGEIAPAPAGAYGFGYDPIFFYPPLGKTSGEMTLQEKTMVSHRARAFRDLARWLRRTL
jgi:XTP/dITP diphosphohydrolase